MTLAAEIGGVALVLQLLSGLSVPRAARARRAGLALVLWLMPFELDRARLRLRAASRCSSSPSRRSSSTRTGARSRTASSRRRARATCGLRLLRRRPRRRGDDPVRGLLLLLRRRRGALDAEGSRPQPRQRADRLLARRPALLRADDLRRRAAPAAGDHRRAARDGRARRAGAARADRPDPRARRHALRGLRRGDRLRLLRRLQRGAVLRLGMGQVPAQRGRAALHARLDRDARCSPSRSSSPASTRSSSPSSR